MPHFLNAADAGFEEDFAALLGAKREEAQDVDDAVAAIIADVRERGDQALIELTAKFDRMELSPERMRFTTGEVDDLVAQVSPEDRAALEHAAGRIRGYHARQMPKDESWTDPEGATLGWRWTPVSAAGLYVPGGLASYPSSVLMNAIPAKVAGVERLAINVPTPDGVANPLVLLAARIAGVDEIYRVGGAQAVAALARASLLNPASGDLVVPLLDLARQKGASLASANLVKASIAELDLGDRGKGDWLHETIARSLAEGCLVVATNDNGEPLKRALQSAGEALTLRPDLVALSALRGQLLANSKKYEDADEALQLALTLSGDRPLTALTLARVKSQLKDYDMAIRLLHLAGQGGLPLDSVAAEFEDAKKAAPLLWNRLKLPGAADPGTAEGDKPAGDKPDKAGKSEGKPEAGSNS